MQNSDSFQFHSEVPPHTGERTFSHHSHSLEDGANAGKKKVSFINESNRAKYSHTRGLDAIVGVYILKTKEQVTSHISFLLNRSISQRS